MLSAVGGDSCVNRCAARGLCGRCNWNTCHDDGRFVEAVIDFLDNEFGVDRSRLFAFGGSNGGMAVHHLVAARLPRGALPREIFALVRARPSVVSHAVRAAH